MSRLIRGAVVLPADAPSTRARVVIELRDITYADERAPVLASVTLTNTFVQPSGRIPFEMAAPDVAAGQQLSLECRVDITGGRSVAAGDLLSTRVVPVPTAGDADSLELPVVLV